MSSDHLQVTSESVVVSSRHGRAPSLMALDKLCQMYALLGIGAKDGWRVDGGLLGSLSLAFLVG